MLQPTDLRIPNTWEFIVAVDTGSYMSAVIAALCPEPYSLLALEEFPNYRYVGGEIELLGISTPKWAATVVGRWNWYTRGKKCVAWADTNSQFKAELANYQLHLMGNQRGLELRVETTREFQMAKDEHGKPSRLFLAPWLSVLPHEMENAQWPDEATSAGKFVRIKRNDHTLDCLEHIASRRPRHRKILQEKGERFTDRFVREHRRMRVQATDVHLGKY